MGLASQLVRLVNPLGAYQAMCWISVAMFCLLAASNTYLVIKVGKAYKMAVLQAQEQQQQYQMGQYPTAQPYGGQPYGDQPYGGQPYGTPQCMPRLL
jgi:hypothetical protein